MSALHGPPHSPADIRRTARMLKHSRASQDEAAGEHYFGLRKCSVLGMSGPDDSNAQLDSGRPRAGAQRRS